jgi:hypothetical protein
MVQVKGAASTVRFGQVFRRVESPHAVTLADRMLWVEHARHSSTTLTNGGPVMAVTAAVGGTTPSPTVPPARLLVMALRRDLDTVVRAAHDGALPPVRPST